MKKRILLCLTFASMLGNAQVQAKHSKFWDDFDNWTKDFVENMEETKKNIDKFFARLKSPKFAGMGLMDKSLVDPNKIAIFESNDGKEWGIKIMVPHGFDKKEVHAEIDEKGFLHITAEKKQSKIEEKKDDESKTYIYKGESFTQKSFSQTIKLPKYIDYKDASKIETSFEEDESVLTIKFPRKEEKIAISNATTLEIK